MKRERERIYITCISKIHLQFERTMAMEVYNSFIKRSMTYSIAKLTFYPFCAFLTKFCNDDALLILTGMLFHITTPEREKLPLNQLHFACGNK